MGIFLKILGLGLLAFLSACNDLSVLSSDQALRPSITDIGKAVAQPGDVISVEGNRLGEKIKVLIGDEKLKLNVDNSKEGSFELPADLELGMKEVTFVYSGDNIKTLMVKLWQVSAVPLL